MVSATGCPAPDRASVEAHFDHAELAPARLEGRTLIDQGLYLPFAIAVVGSYLVVGDRTAADSLVKVYRRNDGALVHAFGRQGSGPGEFRAIWSVRPGPGATPERREAWVFDFTLRRMTGLDLSDSGLRHPDRDRPVVVLRSEATVTGAEWLNDTTIVAVGFFPNGRLGYFDLNGSPRAVVGPLPADGAGIPIPVLQHAYQGTLALKPDRTRLAVANRHAGRIELFTPEGTRLAIIRGPYDFVPQFRAAPGRDSARTPVFASGDALRFGYTAIAATPDGVFGLFSGRTRRGFPGEANFGQFVHLFDWEGRFLQAYDLGQAVFTLDVDPSGRRIYAARHEPEPAVLVFDIPGQAVAPRAD